VRSDPSGCPAKGVSPCGSTIAEARSPDIMRYSHPKPVMTPEDALWEVVMSSEVQTPVAPLLESTWARWVLPCGSSPTGSRAAREETEAPSRADCTTPSSIGSIEAPFFCNGETISHCRPSGRLWLGTSACAGAAAQATAAAVAQLKVIPAAMRPPHCDHQPVEPASCARGLPGCLGVFLTDAPSSPVAFSSSLSLLSHSSRRLVIIVRLPTSRGRAERPAPPTTAAFTRFD